MSDRELCHGCDGYECQLTCAYPSPITTIRQQAAEIEELKRRNSAQLSTLNHMGTLVEKMEEQAAKIEKLREALVYITNPYVATAGNEFSRGFNQAKRGAANIARAALEDTPPEPDSEGRE